MAFPDGEIERVRYIKHNLSLSVSGCGGGAASTAKHSRRLTSSSKHRCGVVGVVKS